MKKLLITFISCTMLLLIFSGCENSKSGTNIEEPSKVKRLEKDQIVFSLNVLSNLLFDVDSSHAFFKDKAKPVMQEILKNATVDSLIGSWEVAWGPAIYSKDTDCGDKCVVDNLLVLFKNKETHNSKKAPDYVLATSGTNAISKFGWFNEDFDVFKMIQWPDTTGKAKDISSIVSRLSQPCNDVTDSTCISIGTSAGVKVLLGLKDPVTDSLIYDKLNSIFYSDKAKDSVELAVAGHSLGGALSPTLALVLKDYQASWNAKKNVRITAWPTAGASPGNVKFKNYFHTSFKGNFYGKMNTMDIVPHAWEPSMIKKIPSIYNGNQFVSSPCILDNLISEVQSKIQTTYNTTKTDTVFASLYDVGDTFKGTYKTLIPGYESEIMYRACRLQDCSIVPDSLTKFKSECEFFIKEVTPKYFEIENILGCEQKIKCKEIGHTTQYLAQAGYQHVVAYNKHFKIDDFNTIMKNYKKNNNMAKTKTPKEVSLSLFNALVNYIKSLKASS